jgi:hypothetical protein
MNARIRTQHPFEHILSVSEEDIEFEFRAYASGLPWSDYLLNPRRLRGSDFLMRWSQGVWSENRLTDAVNKSEEFVAIPYGPSGVAPDNDPRAFELYFERLEEAGLGNLKRPDLLVFKSDQKDSVDALVEALGGLAELPFTTEDKLRPLLDLALVAVECENSLWVARKMPNYGKPLTPQKRMNGQPGMAKTAVLPTIILKNEDLEPLSNWEQANHVPIHIWHVFFDMAFGISLQRALDLFRSGLIHPTEQTFQAPSGASSTKTIYKIYYHYAYELATATSSPELKPAYIEDKNGHILPYVRFEGGELAFSPTALAVLRTIHDEMARG